MVVQANGQTCSLESERFFVRKLKTPPSSARTTTTSVLSTNCAMTGHSRGTHGALTGYSREQRKDHKQERVLPQLTQCRRRGRRCPHLRRDWAQPAAGLLWIWRERIILGGLPGNVSGSALHGVRVWHSSVLRGGKDTQRLSGGTQVYSLSGDAQGLSGGTQGVIKGT